MKNRMSALDCRRMVAELQRTVVGMWLHNVYDLNAKTFILKLSVPEKPKALLLIESGVRFHLTDFNREK
jgi:predicted ribosome quality control (RQC) complex YloA/Tae2 family protein